MVNIVKPMAHKKQEIPNLGWTSLPWLELAHTKAQKMNWSNGSYLQIGVLNHIKLKKKWFGETLFGLGFERDFWKEIEKI